MAIFYPPGGGGLKNFKLKKTKCKIKIKNSHFTQNLSFTVFSSRIEILVLSRVWDKFLSIFFWPTVKQKHNFRENFRLSCRRRVTNQVVHSVFFFLRVFNLVLWDRKKFVKFEKLQKSNFFAQAKLYK